MIADFFSLHSMQAVVAGYALVTGDLKRLTGDSSDCKNDLRQKTKAQGKVVLPTRIGKLGPGRNSSVLVDEGKFDEDFFDVRTLQLFNLKTKIGVT